MIKKSYNPFKMWGSWVGAVWGLLSSFPFAVLIENMIQVGGWRWIPFFPLMISYKLLNVIDIIPLLISSIILGFLIGWGIHSLIRKLRS